MNELKSLKRQLQGLTSQHFGSTDVESMDAAKTEDYWKHLLKIHQVSKIALSLLSYKITVLDIWSKC